METFRKTIENNMNCNGGGLATNITGRFESNRHAIARSEKFTFGEVCSELKKQKNGGLKILANDLLEIYRAAVGEPEWHHAGFLPKQYGGGMKKTYFLSEIPSIEQIEQWKKVAEFKLLERKQIEDLRIQKQEERQKFIKKYGHSFNRVLETPKFAVIETEEMNGKYGWFESQPYKYNLPVYYSGISFKSKKTLEKYHNI